MIEGPCHPRPSPKTQFPSCRDAQISKHPDVLRLQPGDLPPDKALDGAGIRKCAGGMCVEGN